MEGPDGRLHIVMWPLNMKGEDLKKKEKKKKILGALWEVGEKH